MTWATVSDASSTWSAASDNSNIWVNQVSNQKYNVEAIETVTNLFLYSEQIDNSYWTKTRVLAFGSGSTANAGDAPNGWTTADLIVEDATAANSHFVQRNYLFSVSSYSASVFVKRGTGTRNMRIQINSGAFADELTRFANFNLETGTATLGRGDSAYIEDVGNGFYRCSLSFSATTAATTGVLFVFLSGTLGTYNGDGSSSLYLWGTQLEEAPLSGYLQTTTAARSADVLTLSNDLSWEDSGEYSHFIKYLKDDGTLSNAIEVTWAGSNKVAADMTFTSTPQYLFFGWGESDIETSTDWETT